MGPIEGDRNLWIKMEASKLTLEDIRIRMAIARQVLKERKDGLRPEFSLNEDLKVLILEKRLENELFLHFQQGERRASKLSEILNCQRDKILEIFSSLVKKGIVEKEGLILDE
jgi:hypothetical protein